MNWQIIQSIYSSLGVPDQLLDLIIDYDILALCARGKGNRAISLELDMELEDVTCVIAFYFHFNGFENDLDIDVRMWYNRYIHNKYGFIQQCKTISPLLTDEDLENAYRVNKLFDPIERTILSYATTKST